MDMLVCGFAYSVFGTAFIISLDLTPLGDAYLFGNTQSLILVFGKALFGVPILLMEGVGAAIGLIGGVICTFDRDAMSGMTSNPVAGDMIAFFGSICGVGYLTLAKKLRRKMDLFIFTTLLMGIASVCLLIYIFLAIPSATFDRDPFTGAFGWLDLRPTRFPLELYLVYICSFIGTMGFIAVMKYFDLIVVAVVMLLEPIVASVLGVLLGVSPLPGFYTYLGGAAILLGTFLVVLSENHRTESLDVTLAIQGTTPDRSRKRNYYGT